MARHIKPSAVDLEAPVKTSCGLYFPDRKATANRGLFWDLPKFPEQLSNSEARFLMSSALYCL